MTPGEQPIQRYSRLHGHGDCISAQTVAETEINGVKQNDGIAVLYAAHIAIVNQLRTALATAEAQVLHIAGNANTLNDRLNEANAALATAHAQNASLQEALDAQEQKYIDCPHLKGAQYWPCACSFDKLSDVCAIHAPQLKKALADLATAHADLQSWQRRQKETFDALAASEERVKWTPIDAEHLPKVGDEVAAWAYPLTSRGTTSLIAQMELSYETLTDYGYTHFRPINPPQPDTQRIDAGAGAL